jgi:uncharacterized protein (TIGR03118 family)
MTRLSKGKAGLLLAGLIGLTISPLAISTTLASGYDQTNLVSNGDVRAKLIDKNLVNPWGVAFAPGGDFWISDNGSGVTTLYDGAGAASSLVVKIPGPSNTAGAPTGQVFNPTQGFVVSENGKSGPAVFIFVNEDGVISGWSPGVDLLNAIPEADDSKPGLADAVYKGAALATVRGQNFLFATDFHNGRIAVFDSNWNDVTARFPFRDPYLPKGYAPFNIVQLNDHFYVTYAKQDAAKHDDVRGSGHGFVDIYALDGHFLRRFATHGELNSPWGLTFAPKGFGELSGLLLVGNFGDGTIAAYGPASGDFRGYLGDVNGNPLRIGSLWALTFADGVKNQEPGKLYFTSGLKNEGGGLFGVLSPHGK